MYRPELYLLLYLTAVLCGCGSGDVALTEGQIALARTLALGEPAANNEDQANNKSDLYRFGEQLFFDPALSRDHSLSCASCHRPDMYFTDGLPAAIGLGHTSRNTPSLVGVADQQWFYWDGRRDSLWSQALAPIEAAEEMGNNRLQVLRRVGSVAEYRKLYSSSFGRFPVELLGQKIPGNASPVGTTQERQNWWKLDRRTREKANQSFSNLGRAIAEYEKSLVHPRTPFDEFIQVLDGQSGQAAAKPMDDEAIAGLKLFLDEPRTHCLRCHNGRDLSNGDFHNIGSAATVKGQPELGRFAGVQAVLVNEFNCLGNYSNLPPEECTALRFLSRNIDDQAKGAFKTPTLRNLLHTAPYFHDGRYSTLEEVVEHYLDIDSPDAEIPAIKLSARERRQLVSFLRVLSAENADE